MNDTRDNSASFIPEVGLTEIDGQPRARDTDIGERLGFSRHRDIRPLIEANRHELEGFGPLARRHAAPISGKGRVSDVLEYWLNEEQVLLIASISKAPNAPAVRAMLIRVFVAWRRGHLAMEAIPSTLIEQIRRTDGIVKSTIHKVTEMERTQAAVATMLASISAVVQPNIPVMFRHGKTAGQIWSANGFLRIKVTSWFSNRLMEAGCLLDGRAEVGGRSYRLFDPDKADAWLRNGGRLLVEKYLQERNGQKVLRLVPKQAGA